MELNFISGKTSMDMDGFLKEKKNGHSFGKLYFIIIILSGTKLQFHGIFSTLHPESILH